MKEPRMLLPYTSTPLHRRALTVVLILQIVSRWHYYYSYRVSSYNDFTCFSRLDFFPVVPRRTAAHGLRLHPSLWYCWSASTLGMPDTLGTYSHLSIWEILGFRIYSFEWLGGTTSHWNDLAIPLQREKIYQQWRPQDALPGCSRKYPAWEGGVQFYDGNALQDSQE